MELITKKLCLKCKEEKPFSEFRKSKNGKFGLHGYCKLCQDIKSKESYENNKKHRIELQKEWNEGHPSQSKEFKRKWAEEKRRKELEKSIIIN